MLQLQFVVTKEVGTKDKTSDDVSFAHKETRRDTCVPLYATPKRPRTDLPLTPNVPYRDWKVDPISGAAKYGAMHRMALLNDSEWMRVLRNDDRKYPRLIKMDPKDWKNLMSKLQVSQLSNM